MWKEFVGQALSIAATVMTLISYQLNKKNHVLATQTAACILMTMGYFFLGATSGFALNVVGVVRNLTYFALGDRKKLCVALGTVFAAVMCVLGVISWQGWFSLLIIVALMANTLFLALGDPQLLRKSILFTSSSILIYNLFVFSVGGIANEAVAITSSIVGILRFRKPCTGGKTTEKALVEEG